MNRPRAGMSRASESPEDIHSKFRPSTFSEVRLQRVQQPTVDNGHHSRRFSRASRAAAQWLMKPYGFGKPDAGRTLEATIAKTPGRAANAGCECPSRSDTSATAISQPNCAQGAPPAAIPDYRPDRLIGERRLPGHAAQLFSNAGNCKHKSAPFQ